MKLLFYSFGGDGGGISEVVILRAVNRGGSNVAVVR